MTHSTVSFEAERTLQDLAASCVRFVERAVGTAPDYTPDTLPFVDHWLRSLDEMPSEEISKLIVPAAGAYLGEVLRKHYGSVRWRFDGQDYENARLEFEHVFLAFNPFGIALEALSQEDAGGWGAHVQLLPRDHDTVTSSLENVDDVSEEDYYRLSIRYEVIDQIVSVLQDLRSARNETSTVLGPEVYEIERGERAPTMVH